METVHARFVSGEAYEIGVRQHHLLVDQPAEAGGGDAAPTPTELFVASLAACVAFYAGRYLSRHDLPRDGLAVSADYDMAADRPARVAAVRLTIQLPDGVPAARHAPLLAVASHCTVHNSLTNAPEVSVSLAGPSPAVAPEPGPRPAGPPARR